MLIQRGQPVAIVGARRWYLAPQIEALPRDAQDRRGIAALCPHWSATRASCTFQPTPRTSDPPCAVVTRLTVAGRRARTNSQDRLDARCATVARCDALTGPASGAPRASAKCARARR